MTQHQSRGQRGRNRLQPQLEPLECRKLFSVTAEPTKTPAAIGHPVEVRQLGQNTNGRHPKVNSLMNLVTIEATKE